VDENGTASHQTTYQVTLANREENFLLDEDGSALIVHAEADDYENNPVTAQ